MSLILGGVGLGVCSVCNAPGAFWYSSVIFRLCGGGVWMCDSCTHPDMARARMERDLAFWGRGAGKPQVAPDSPEILHFD